MACLAIPMPDFVQAFEGLRELLAIRAQVPLPPPVRELLEQAARHHVSNDGSHHCQLKCLNTICVDRIGHFVSDSSTSGTSNRLHFGLDHVCANSFYGAEQHSSIELTALSPPSHHSESPCSEPTSQVIKQALGVAHDIERRLIKGFTEDADPVTGIRRNVDSQRLRRVRLITGEQGRDIDSNRV